MVWFFLVVFMVQGILPVERREHNFSTERLCNEGREKLEADFSKAGQGYVMTTCDSKVKEGK